MTIDIIAIYLDKEWPKCYFLSTTVEVASATVIQKC